VFAACQERRAVACGLVLVILVFAASTRRLLLERTSQRPGNSSAQSPYPLRAQAGTRQTTGVCAGETQ